VVPFGDSAAIPATSVVLLEKALVLGLELLLEDDATNAGAALGELLRCPNVRRVDPGIVRKLAGLAHAGVEGLTTVAGVGSASAFEHGTSAFGQRHECRSRSAHDIRHGLDEPVIAKPF
jgi:hypothetical protein